MTAAVRLARHLHPGAWWLWALGMAAAATRTTNPLLLLLLCGVAGTVVAARRTDAPWASAYGFFVKVALVVLAVRVVLQALFGGVVDGPTVLVTLPELQLPAWAAGLRVGGPVSAEALVLALHEGLRLATILVCVGAANALAAPSRLLKAVPAALYELGVAVVVALTVTPQLVTSLGRVRDARRLRGRAHRGPTGVRALAIPVLQGALERSVELAAAMDSRGYGRRAAVPAAQRRVTAGLVLGGLLGSTAGVYGLLLVDTSTALAAGVLAAGVAAAAAGMALGGRRSPRTRYRPDRWAAAEWLVAGSGLAVAAAFVALAARSTDVLQPMVPPLRWPVLPLLPVAALALGLVPAVAAPPPPRGAA